MATILIVSLLATIGFFRKAKLLGLAPGKPASLAMCSAGLFLICRYLLRWAVNWVTMKAEVSQLTHGLILFQLDVFVVLGYCAYLGRSWKNLDQGTGSKRTGGLPSANR